MAQQPLRLVGKRRLQPRRSSEFNSLQMNSLRKQSGELIRDIPPYQTGTGKWRENDPLAAIKHLA
jgi:hypothetical protein